MKTLHIHISVADLDTAVQFYSGLFDTQPTQQKSDYAQWKLDDPKVNFAISTHSSELGLNHLGVQVDDEAELNALRQRLSTVGETFDEGVTTCCYAESDKSWIQDPQGIAWEAFHTMAEAEVFSQADNTQNSACCVPKAASSGCC